MSGKPSVTIRHFRVSWVRSWSGTSAKWTEDVKIDLGAAQKLVRGLRARGKNRIRVSVRLWIAGGPEWSSDKRPSDWLWIWDSVSNELPGERDFLDFDRETVESRAVHEFQYRSDHAGHDREQAIREAREALFSEADRWDTELPNPSLAMAVIRAARDYRDAWREGSE